MGRIIAVGDLGNGDGGKGTNVDYLARRFPDTHTVVRHNGGAQAVHNVVTPEGTHHGFAQFGSATFVRDVGTHLSRFMLVYPTNLLREAETLATLGVPHTLKRVSIDERGPILTPYHKAVNWLREIDRGAENHGTTGLGIGELMQDIVANVEPILYAGDLRDTLTTARKVRHIRRRKNQEIDAVKTRIALTLTSSSSRHIIDALDILTDDRYLADFLEDCRRLANSVRIVPGDYLGEILRRDGTVIFEGAQGVLLDEWYGFHPHTTWSTTTFANVDTLLAEHGYRDAVTKIGVLRGYATRHGAGPFMTESVELTKLLPDQHNSDASWQGQFRVGHLDLMATRYALDVVGRVDMLAVTCMDRMEVLPEWQVCDRYSYEGEISEELTKYFTSGTTGTHAPITRIRVKPDRTDLIRQEALTRHLFRCSPKLTTAPRDIEGYLSLLEEKLRVPVGIVSSGSTANYKRIRRPEFLERRR